MAQALQIGDFYDFHSQHSQHSQHSNEDLNPMIDLTHSNEEMSEEEEEDHDELDGDGDEDEDSEEEIEEFVPWSDADVPDEFKCPISLSVMREPVLCSDGFYYDRECIEDWLSAHSRSPMTNLRMDDKRTHRDRVLALKIAQWKDEQWLAHHSKLREQKNEEELEAEVGFECDQNENENEEGDDEYEFDGEYSDEDDEFDIDEDSQEDDDDDEEDGDEAMKW